MSRPKKQRCVELRPCVNAFLPVQNSPAAQTIEITECICLELDEMEAIRLADYCNLYHEEAARRMGVSRVTFGRILKKGRQKVARALIEGLAIKFERSEKS